MKGFFMLLGVVLFGLGCSGDSAPFSGNTNNNPDGGAAAIGDANPLIDAPKDAITNANPDKGILYTEAGWNVGNQPTCSGTVYKCSDGKDNDGDGLIDSQDPECVGPCDDDEASFATGIPGDNMDACKQDCFFDGNSGGGEGCQWNLKCDPKSPGAHLAKACPYDANYSNCPATQSAECIKNCQGLTPNGCDCFGCCVVFANGTPYTIFLGSGPTCTTATPQNCAPCTQTTSCVNDCAECEICLGKTINDLPAKCFQTPGSDGGSVVPREAGSKPPLPTCSNGAQGCLDNSYCPSGYFCLTGCCIQSPV